MNLPEPIGQAALAFFQKLLGPVGEAAEFLSDKIRFYRWKSSLRVLQRAREIAQKNDLDVKEVPLKFLIPFMERSSLEDESDDELIERWATLLAQATKDPNSIRPIFVDILSRLSAESVKALEKIVSTRMMDSIRSSKISAFERAAGVYLAAVQDITYEHIRDTVKEITASKSKREYYDDLMKVIIGIKDIDRPLYVEHAVVSFVEFAKDDIFVQTEQFDFSSLDTLVSCGLITRRSFRFHVDEAEIFLSVIVPTVLGIHFVGACRGDNLQITNPPDNV